MDDCLCISNMPQIERKCGKKVAGKKQSALSSQHSAKEGPCSRERSKIGCSYYSLGLWPQEIWASRFPRAARALTITPSRAKPKARVPVAPIQTRSRFTHVRNGRWLGRQRDQVR